MNTLIISSLEKLLGGPHDGPLLRFSLGNEWLKAGDPARAAECLRAAVKHYPAYSAAFKLLGRALSDSGQTQAALAAYAQGIEVAEAKGDVQAAKEMRIFAKRLSKSVEQNLEHPA